MNSTHASFYILSPVTEPWAYAVFAAHWISSLTCIVVSIAFLRKGKGAWWSLVALAFSLPLLGYAIECYSHGLPPLPYGLISPVQQLSPTEQGNASATFTQTSQVSMTIDTVTPLMACALIWAYFTDKNQIQSKAAPSEPSNV
jgi:hypothetical protein